jgi:hypothetical protein
LSTGAEFVKQQIRIKELEAAIKEQKANIQAARVASGSDGGAGAGTAVTQQSKLINGRSAALLAVRIHERRHDSYLGDMTHV